MSVTDSNTPSADPLEVRPAEKKDAASGQDSDILTRDKKVKRAKRKLLAGRALIDEALRELEELEAA